MKKKLLFAVLPILALVGCTAQGTRTGHKIVESPFVRGEENGLPAVTVRGDEESNHITYLMMGPFGYLSIDGAPVKGAVSDLFYENTIILKADAGKPLPDSLTVKTTVSGATFRGWAYYDVEALEAPVWPEYVKTVPTAEGLALKAIFDGVDAGGNTGGGGSGGGGGGSGGGTTTTGFGILVNGTTDYIGESKGTNFEGYDEYLCKGISLNAGDTFALYDPSTLATWSVDINPYSFSPDPEHATSDPARVATYVTKGATNFTVVQAFRGDFYIQIMYQQDRLYIQLA